MNRFTYMVVAFIMLLFCVYYVSLGIKDLSTRKGGLKEVLVIFGCFALGAVLGLLAVFQTDIAEGSESTAMLIFLGSTFMAGAGGAVLNIHMRKRNKDKDG